jgi:cytochrome c oxidase subunit 2
LHQWYWSYEYSDYETESGDPIEFDSYMIPDSELEIGQTRLLDVDNPIVLPSNTHVRFIVTSTDVIHAFAIPAAGVKIDAAPGRLNQSSFFSDRESELYGQCSELCGTYHGFMPIKIDVVNLENYLGWISSLSLGIFLTNKRGRIVS